MAKRYKNLNRPTDQRLAMLYNCVLGLFESKSIVTTDTRAKEVKRVAEKLITIALKEDNFVGKRKILKQIANKKVLIYLKEILQKYKFDKGGYTRIIKLGFRKGDGAPLSKLEFVEKI